jgi:Zn-dependent protease with chaperone function
MITITGNWYDGRTSTAVGAKCTIYDSGAIRVVRQNDGHVLATLSRFLIKTSPRLANTPRYLYFPAGEKMETNDNDTVDRLTDQFQQTSRMRLVHILESRWRYILLAVLFMGVFLWGSIRYGVPFVAKQIAYRLPPSIHRVASEQTLAMLDRAMLDPSALEDATQQRVLAHFAPVLAAHPDLDLKVLFRKGGAIGPNALALPDGTIIFTDEIVHIAHNDDELLTVLVHEVGHVIHRHGMRSVIQDSLLAFTLLAMTGDVSGSSELFLGLPVLLTELAYSRGFEREADRYALSYLKAHNLRTDHFAHLMRRIDQTDVARQGESKRKWRSYLSTHPLTEERIRAFEHPAP